MAKVLEFIVNSPLEEVWEKTMRFWEVKRCKIIDPAFSQDDQSRIMDVSHGAGMISWGEDYTLELFRLPEDSKKTRVVVQIRLTFGYGTAWYAASKMLKEWALFVGTQPQEFAKGLFYGTWIGLVACIVLIIVISAVVSGLALYPYGW